MLRFNGELAIVARWVAVRKPCSEKSLQMNDDGKGSSNENARQLKALSELSDEVMSMLHAHPLRSPSIESDTVIGWLHQLYDIVQKGLGRPSHFSSN